MMDLQRLRVGDCFYKHGVRHEIKGFEELSRPLTVLGARVHMVPVCKARREDVIVHPVEWFLCDVGGD